MFILAALKGFFTGKINIIFLVIIASLCTIIGVQYLDGKAKNSEITAKEKQIETLVSQIGSQTNTITQQRTDLQTCNDATVAMQKAADKRAVDAKTALDAATKQAQDNLNYAKNLIKLVPTGSNDYDSSKNLMNQLIQRRAGK